MLDLRALDKPCRSYTLCSESRTETFRAERISAIKSTQPVRSKVSQLCFPWLQFIVAYSHEGALLRLQELDTGCIKSYLLSAKRTEALFFPFTSVRTLRRVNASLGCII